MQIAAHTFSFRERPLDEALRTIAQLGFEHVEVWLGHATEGPAAAAVEVRRHALEVAAVGAGGFYSDDLEPVRRASALAESLHARVVVGCIAPPHADAVAAALPPELALCVENHWYQAVAYPSEVRRVVDAHTGFAACLDTGHALLAGVDPAAFVRSLDGMIRHVHLKEAQPPRRAVRLLGRRLRHRLLARPEPTFPGAGRLDVTAVVRALQDCGFDGTVTVEHEGARAEEALVALRAQLAAAGV